MSLSLHLPDVFFVHRLVYGFWGPVLQWWSALPVPSHLLLVSGKMLSTWLTPDVYFVAQTVEAWPGTLVRLTSAAFCPPSLVFCVLPYFLASQDASGLSCTFPAVVLGSVISPKIPVSFIGKWHLETKVSALGVFLAPGVLLLQTQWTELIRVCTSPFTHTCLQSSPCPSVCTQD